MTSDSSGMKLVSVSGGEFAVNPPLSLLSQCCVSGVDVGSGPC